MLHVCKNFTFHCRVVLNVKCASPAPVGAMNNALCSSFINIFSLTYSRNKCSILQGPTGVLGIGYHCCFCQVLMVSIWFILGNEYQTENDFWVLKYQFQFWYQKSQKNLVSGIMKLERKFPPIPLNFQNIVWHLYASFW